MSYTQQQVDDFWFGQGGSAGNIQPGAYVTMKWVDVVSLITTSSAAYNADWAALWLYVQQAGVQPTGANGFTDRNSRGGVPCPWYTNTSPTFNGPTKS